MMHAGLIEKRSVFLQVLSEDQVFEIKRAAIDIMQNVGFKVLHAWRKRRLRPDCT